MVGPSSQVFSFNNTGGTIDCSAGRVSVHCVFELLSRTKVLRSEVLDERRSGIEVGLRGECPITRMFIAECNGRSEVPFGSRRQI